MQRTVSGRTGWYLDDELWASTGGNTIRRGGHKVLGEHVVHPFEDVDPAAWSVKERLELMDREVGLVGEVVYPNGVGFALARTTSLPSRTCRTAHRRPADLQRLLRRHPTESDGRPPTGDTPDLGHGPHQVREMDRLIHQGVRGLTSRTSRSCWAGRAARIRTRTPVWDLFKKLRCRRELPHRCRVAQGRTSRR